MLPCFHTKRRGTRRAPDAVLWLIDDNPLATANLKAAAKAEGLTHDRLCFTRRLGYYQYAASLTEADLYLDTFPYNCGSTARDVVLAGLPMVSMAGQSVVSRMASSAVGVGRQESINTLVRDHYNYIEIALSVIQRASNLSFEKQRRQSHWPAGSFDSELLTRCVKEMGKPHFVHGTHK